MAPTDEQDTQQDVERDVFTGTETTGHEWDGIKELNTPLPRWWLWVWVVSIVWAVWAWVIYPAWPSLSDHTKGTAGYSSRAEVMDEVAAARAAQSSWLVRLDAADLGAIAADPDLRHFAVTGGASAYKLHCAACHGSGAEGAAGIPNLNDDDWLWGGTLDDIFLTINHGVRAADDDDTRLNDMPAFGADEMLTAAEINVLAGYVLSFTDDNAGEAASQPDVAVVELYADNCAACHGDMGEGIHDLGGPALNDAIWHYGGSREEIIAQMNAPRHGMMPSWSGRLAPTTIKQLAVYVHGLGGGE